MSDISKIEINGETYDIKDAVARESGGGGDSKIVHGSFGEYGDVTVTGGGMIILCGDNSVLVIYAFYGRTAILLSGSRNDYAYDSTTDGVNIYDGQGYTETLYTIIYA